MKKIGIFLLLLLTLLLVSCKKPKQVKFEDDYPSMKDVTHVFEKTDYTTALNVILNDTAVVILAFDTKKYACPFCTEVIPLLNDVALEVGWDQIYYLDIYNMRTQNNTEYRLLLGYLESQTNSLLTRNGVKTLVVPDVYFIKDGVIVGHHIATLYNDEGAFILGLNNEEVHELKNIYRDLFSLIK